MPEDAIIKTCMDPFDIFLFFFPFRHCSLADKSIELRLICHPSHAERVEKTVEKRQPEIRRRSQDATTIKRSKTSSEERKRLCLEVDCLKKY